MDRLKENRARRCRLWRLIVRDVRPGSWTVTVVSELSLANGRPAGLGNTQLRRSVK